MLTDYQCSFWQGFLSKEKCHQAYQKPRNIFCYLRVWVPNLVQKGGLQCKFCKIYPTFFVDHKQTLPTIQLTVSHFPAKTRCH